MPRRGQSKEFLRRLRMRHGLGEFSRGRGRGPGRKTSPRSRRRESVADRFPDRALLSGGGGSDRFVNEGATASNIPYAPMSRFGSPIPTAL
jgi:hypothetical protein